MASPFAYRVGRKKTVARILFFIFFVLATSTLLFGKQMELLTSRRALDRLIRMLGCYLCITIIAITTIPRHFLQLSLLITGVILLIITFLQQAGSRRSILLVAGMILSVLVLYHSHRRRLRTRAERSSRRYIISGTGGFLGVSALLLSAGIVATLQSATFDCRLIQDNLRRSGIRQHFTQTSVGELLGLNSQQLEQLSDEDEALATGSGVLQTLLRRKNRLIDQAVEQQGVLQQNICGLVVQQIERLQEKSRWQLAAILLLYILLRPALSIVFRIAMPLYLLIRKFLFTTGFLHTQWVQKKVLEVEMEEE